jgi:hypothetical protein
MERRQAKQEAKRVLLSGFKHHDYQRERRLLSLLLQEGGDEVKFSGLSLDTYVDVLAPRLFAPCKMGSSA